MLPVALKHLLSITRFIVSPMKANRIRLWKNTERFRLENGFIVGTNQYQWGGGVFITWIEYPDGRTWQASSPDAVPLPEWAKEWVDKDGLVRPGFTNEGDAPDFEVHQ